MPDRVTDKEPANVDKVEPRKSAGTIVEQQVKEGLQEFRLTNRQMLISGFAAGLELGFGPFLMAAVLSYADGRVPAVIQEFLLAHMYTIGFIFVVLGRSLLFTEQTAMAVLPFINGEARLRQIGRLWGLVYIANLAGGFVFAWIIVVTGPGLGLIAPKVLGNMASSMLYHPWWTILLSATLAGWMMALLSWLITASRDTISQVALTWLVTSAIGFAHLHHVISGTIEVLAGIFAAQGVHWVDFGRFLLWSTIGNSIGGVVFVAVLKYGYSKEKRAQ